MTTGSAHSMKQLLVELIRKLDHSPPRSWREAQLGIGVSLAAEGPVGNPTFRGSGTSGTGLVFERVEFRAAKLTSGTILTMPSDDAPTMQQVGDRFPGLTLAEWGPATIRPWGELRIGLPDVHHRPDDPTSPIAVVGFWVNAHEGQP